MRIRVDKPGKVYGRTGALEVGTEFEIDGDTIPAAWADAVSIVRRGPAPEAEPVVNPASTEPPAAKTEASTEGQAKADGSDAAEPAAKAAAPTVDTSKLALKTGK